MQNRYVYIRFQANVLVFYSYVKDKIIPFLNKKLRIVSSGKVMHIKNVKIINAFLRERQYTT